MSGPAARGTGYRTAWRHRDFRLLLIGTIVDQAGSWAYNVALAVYVYSETHSAAWLGAATVARFVSALLFSTYAGVIADRFERTGVIAVASLLSAVLMIGLAAAAALSAPVLVAIVLATISAAATSVFSPATSALVPDLLGESDLAAGNALISTVENAAVIVGPAVGAGVLLVGDPSVAFLVNAATFLFSAAMVLRIRQRSRPVDVTAGGTDGPMQQVLVGLRQIRSSSKAGVLVGYSVLASCLYGVDTVLFVVVSDVKLGTGPDGFGYLLAGLGTGGLLAAGLVNRLASSPRLGILITLGMVVYSLPTAALIWVHAPAVAFLLQVIRGAGTLVVDVLAITALQRSLPSDVMARVFGVFWALVLAGIAVGALITPPLLSALGLDTLLLIFGIGASVVALAAYPRLRRLDQAALARLRRLEPLIALLDVLDIFAAAPRPVLEQLAAAATEFAVAPGIVLVHEDNSADALYVLAVGEVSVSARGEAASTRRLRTLKAPAYFGEIGLIERIPRTATVRALEKCKLLRIGGSDFLNALSSTPASTSLLEGARTRLHRSHPSYRPTDSSPLAEPLKSGA